jgi:hypothetical protein
LRTAYIFTSRYCQLVVLVLLLTSNRHHVTCCRDTVRTIYSLLRHHTTTNARYKVPHAVSPDGLRARVYACASKLLIEGGDLAALLLPVVQILVFFATARLTQFMSMLFTQVFKIPTLEIHSRRAQVWSDPPFCGRVQLIASLCVCCRFDVGCTLGQANGHIR